MTETLEQVLADEREDAETAALRVKAARHQAELEKDRLFLSAQRVAARWGLSVSTVRAIPFAELPFESFGTGLQRTRRRYHPRDVEAYEARRRAIAEQARRAS